MLVFMTAKAACAQSASVQTTEPMSGTAKEKKFTITPRAGMAVSKFKGDFIYKNAENIWGPALGVDAEYQFSSLMGVALGYQLHL